MAAALLGGCAGDSHPVDYLDSPTRVLPPQSVPDRAYSDPVVPTSLDAAPLGDAGACELLPPGEVGLVIGVADLTAVPAHSVRCSYQAAGEALLRLSRHDYPGPTQPDQVLAAMVSSYAELEPMTDVGDAAVYVPDTGGSLPPALFVAEGRDDGGVAVLRLAFDPEHEAPKAQLAELAELATDGL